MSELTTKLAELKFLAGMKADLIELLAGCATQVEFEVDQIVFREGEDADRLYILCEGRVAIEIHGAPQGTLTIQTLEKDAILGWSWLIDPYRWHFTARSLEPSRAVAFDGVKLRELCETNQRLGYEVLRRFLPVICNRLESTRLQLLDLYGVTN